MTWKAIYLCKKCNVMVSNYVRLTSGGICPHCGNLDNGYVVDCYKAVGRPIKISPWWQFWKNETYWECKGNLSKEVSEAIARKNDEKL